MYTSSEACCILSRFCRYTSCDVHSFRICLLCDLGSSFCVRGSEDFVIVDGNNRSFCLCHPKFDAERLLRPAMVARTYILWNIFDSILQVKYLFSKMTPHTSRLSNCRPVCILFLQNKFCKVFPPVIFLQGKTTLHRLGSSRIPYTVT